MRGVLALSFDIEYPKRRWRRDGRTADEDQAAIDQRPPAGCSYQGPEDYGRLEGVPFCCFDKFRLTGRLAHDLWGIMGTRFVAL